MLPPPPAFNAAAPVGSQLMPWWHDHAWIIRLVIILLASPPLWMELLGLHEEAFTGVMCRITFVVILMGKGRLEGRKHWRLLHWLSAMLCSL